MGYVNTIDKVVPELAELVRRRETTEQRYGALARAADGVRAWRRSVTPPNELWELVRRLACGRKAAEEALRETLTWTALGPLLRAAELRLESERAQVRAELEALRKQTEAVAKTVAAVMGSGQDASDKDGGGADEA